MSEGQRTEDNPTLLLSSTQTVHEENCPTMRHVEHGYAPRRHWVEGVEDLRTYEYIAKNALQITGTRNMYRRCSVCAPDISEYAKWGRRTVGKVAGTLGHLDIGRESEYGFVTSIEHGRMGTVLALDGGRLEHLDPREQVRFFVRGTVPIDQGES